MLHHQAIVGSRAIIIRQTFIDCETEFHIEYRPINPRTGKPWQASRTILRLQDTNKAKAMRVWLYECANARKQVQTNA